MQHQHALPFLLPLGPTCLFETNVMKSAYELAMERMGGDDEPKPISKEQKAEIAEITSKYQAKIAKRKIFLEKNLADSIAAGDEARADEFRQQIAHDTSSLEEESEQAKEKVRKG